MLVAEGELKVLSFKLVSINVVDSWEMSSVMHKNIQAAKNISTDCSHNRGMVANAAWKALGLV